MDTAVSNGNLTFNGPFEAGMRAVAILAAAFPRELDIQRLTAFDYLLVHTEMLGGPEDLHPETPISTPATQVRRSIVQDGLHLMMTRDLVARSAREDGIVYQAGELAETFLDALQSPYSTELKSRATWLVDHLGSYEDGEFDKLMRRFFDQWVMEFQHVEQSLGGAA
jgi:hypothetical protein